MQALKTNPIAKQEQHELPWYEAKLDVLLNLSDRIGIDEQCALHLPDVIEALASKVDMPPIRLLRLLNDGRLLAFVKSSCESGKASLLALPNSYESRLNARYHRFLARAARKRSESDALYQSAKRSADSIPFGQPILIGHHSESRDRRFRERFINRFRRSASLQTEAERLAVKAAAVGSAGISSDDPDAIFKLLVRLVELEQTHQVMKDVNSAIRNRKFSESEKVSKVASLLRVSESKAAEMLKPDCMGNIGFAGYSLQNSNANIARVRERIEVLSKRRSLETFECAGIGYEYREDVEENRVMFLFNGKPEFDVREVLKRHAFKWSPTRGAWVRMLSGSGKYAGKCVREFLDQQKKGGA